VPAGGRGEELVGREGAALASQPEEGDAGEWGEKTEVKRGAVQTVVYLHEMWPTTREWEARKHFKAD
jgi:hypothetical protein